MASGRRAGRGRGRRARRPGASIIRRPSEKSTHTLDSHMVEEHDGMEFVGPSTFELMTSPAWLNPGQKQSETVLNRCYGGFGVSDELKGAWRGEYGFELDAARHDSRLVDLVNRLKERARLEAVQVLPLVRARCRGSGDGVRRDHGVCPAASHAKSMSTSFSLADPWSSRALDVPPGRPPGRRRAILARPRALRGWLCAARRAVGRRLAREAGEHGA